MPSAEALALADTLAENKRADITLRAALAGIKLED
jgi:hypothetical protein